MAKDSAPTIRRVRVSRGLIVAGASMLVLLAATELVFFFPVTPWQLSHASGSELPPNNHDSIRLAFVGDIMLADAGQAILRKRGYRYPLKGLSGLLRSCDAAIGNLEGPIAVQAQRNQAKRWAYKMDPRAATALSEEGLTAVTLANNHILDCGAPGVLETRRFLTESGVRYFGAGQDDGQARTPLIMSIRGMRIAVLGYLAPYQLLSGRPVSMRHLGAGHRSPGAALATVANLRSDIGEIRSRMDIVIVFLHMGDRYQTMPTEYEQALAREAVDAGADAVMACGTHIMGPVERYRGKPIVYSLGNFAFGSGNLRATFSQMAFLDVSRRGVEALRLVPIYTTNWNPMVWFQPKLLVGWQRRRAIDRLAALSARLGTRVIRRPSYAMVAAAR